MVGSAVAQEAVNEVLSRIKEGYAEKSDAKEHIERMEMAHIKLEAALEASNKWNITSPPLLRWRSKLKRATQECDHTLRRCRQRLQEEEEVKQGLQSSSFPKRVSHTAMSFVSSMFSSGSGDDKLRGSTAVRRFERFADGASEFLSLQLSESTDIVGVVVRCLQLYKPCLELHSETVKTKLTQIPMQDLCWVFDAYSGYGCDEQQNSLETMCSKWYRPNPFCCQQLEHLHAQSSFSKSLTCDIYMETVIQVYLLGHVALSVGNNRQSAVIDGESQTSPTRDFPYLKLGAHFAPHASFEDLSPTVGGSVSEIINDGAKHCAMYANISFEQLGEITMPKAVDCLSRNLEATSYQMSWKSKHGSAYLRVEKTSWRATTRKDKVGKRCKQRPDKKVPAQGWTGANIIGQGSSRCPAR
ncbi:unnamed protein product [Miscanthus lutarioriparius]|uniref:Uncharacterized protein n=1 Tax=Miscanthus lutarioriparius TaxID=422564 RepID=A0A811Q2Y4_9POAL|nr:unnamed protein product [Miscanthus lutarioriparius]